MKNSGSHWKTMLAAGLVLAFGAFASPASAQRADDMKQSQNPCVGDAYKFCGTDIPDRAKVASCLFKNKAQLTPACRTEIGGGGGGKKVGKARKGKRHGGRGRRHRR